MYRKAVSLLIVLTAGAPCAGRTAGAPATVTTHNRLSEAAEWSQFRGPGRSGVAAETGLVRSWPEQGPDILWRHPIGEGLSGIAVAGERLWTMFAEGDEEFLGCFRVRDGGELWRISVGETFRDEFGTGPRSTPTLDGELVYALGGKGRLVAARRATGEPVWQLELHSEKLGFYGPQITPTGTPTGVLQLPLFGYAGSPLVVGEHLVLESGTGGGGTYVALDKKTGEVRWTALDEPGMTYSSPMTIEVDGRREIVVLTMSEVVGLLPTGEVSWRHPWSVTVAQPVFVPPDKVFVSTTNHAGYDNEPGAMLLWIRSADGRTTAEPVWRNRAMRNVAAASVYYEDNIYGFDNATLRAIAAATGETRWAQRGLGKGSLIIADDLLFLWGDQGTLTLAEASPESYRQLGQVKVFEAGRTWTPPTLADGKLYLRGNRELVCLDVKENDR